MATEMRWMILNVDGKQVRYDFSQAAWDFYKACNEDKGLGAELAKLPVSDRSAIAAFAQTQGYVTTASEIEQYQVADAAASAVLAAQRPASDELTDAELDVVTGGRNSIQGCDGCQQTLFGCITCP